MVQVTFSEVELAGDVQKFIAVSSTACDTAALKAEIASFNEDDFLKVTKQIASPMKIINVKKIDEEYLAMAM